MNRLSVVSNAFKSVGFNKKNGTLEVEFNNGRVFQYEKFPTRLYRQFINAESIGTFFHSQIRPFFQGVEIAPDISDETQRETLTGQLEDSVNEGDTDE